LDAASEAEEAVRASSVDPREVAHYRNLAKSWWDEAGPFWPLHRLNDLRVPWIREQACRHFDRDPGAERPLRGLQIVDIGCGGGILSESMARLGASVLGVDVVDRNIAVAREHATGDSALDVRYQLTSAEALVESGARYDLVLNMEVVEHVADLPTFMSAACRLLAPRGQMFVATINRTPLAWLFAIFGAEYVLRWMPRGTHRYEFLRKPRELAGLLMREGLEIDDRTGVRVNPFRKSLHLTESMRVNYMLCASRTVHVVGSGTG
jgi:2-polyprenyl-6-hydroxyphenyl methylase/3-demethylubiquinone-9 3-methyltransferase